MFFSKYLADLFFEDPNKTIMVDIFNNQLSKNNDLEQKFSIITNYFSVLSSSSNICIVRKGNRIFDLIINDLFIIRIKHNNKSFNQDTLISPNLRIRKSYTNLDIPRIKKLCLENNLMFDEANDLVNIFSCDRIPIRDFFMWIHSIILRFDIHI